MNSEKEEPSLLVTLDQAAERLSVSRRTIEREIARGHLARPVKIGTATRLRVSDLLRYLDSLSAGTIQPT